MGRDLSAVTFTLFVATASAGAQQALPVRDPLDDRAVLPAEEPQQADERLWATLRNARSLRAARGDEAVLAACVAGCRTRWAPRRVRRVSRQQADRYGAWASRPNVSRRGRAHGPRNAPTPRP